MPACHPDFRSKAETGEKLVYPCKSAQLAEGQRSPSAGIGQRASGDVGFHDFLYGRAWRVIVVGIERQPDDQPRRRRQA